MGILLTLLDIACGRPLPVADAGRARRTELIVVALLASLVFAACWGAAAASRTPMLAVSNLYKVPMAVLLSCAFAAPAGVLAWRLAGAAIGGTDLALGFAGSVFGGTLVLAVLAPVVALYDHSSAWAGHSLAVASALLSLATGLFMFVRGVLRRLPAGAPKLAALVPVLVIVTMQLATLLQLAAILAPIFPERTPFSGGIDQLGR